MHRQTSIAGLALVPLLVALSSTPTVARTVASAQSKTCSAKAAEQGLVGEERSKFEATCMKGALTPKHPTKLDRGTAGAKAVTSPSGADRTTRSQACNAEASKRGLQGGGFEAFRKGCLASAAPVSAIETSQRPTTPTPAKPKLESLTNTPPR